MVYKLKSHPEILLKDHLQQVLNTGIARFEANGIHGGYEALLRVVLAFHDLGKASHYFQSYLEGDTGKASLAKHSEISALWAFHYCKQKLKLPILQCIFAYVCIKRHHGNLENIRDMYCPSLDQESLRQIAQAIDYNEMANIYNDLGFAGDFLMDEKNSLPLNLENRLLRTSLPELKESDWMLLEYLFSLLIWADKYSAIFAQSALDASAKTWNIAYLDNYRQRFSDDKSQINSIRNEAYHALAAGLEKEHKLYSLNMPTGSGKTLNSLKLAIAAMQQDRSLQRIIYCLPFTSVIDQNHQVFQDILRANDIQPESDLILAHHHLADYAYISEDEYSMNEAEYLVETWESRLVVTTFVQLLNSFLSCQNSNLKKLHRLANAVIILDEVQNIPHKYWQLMQECLILLANEYNATILLVTATLPLIFEATQIKELATNAPAWFQALNRIELHSAELDTKIEISYLSELVLNTHQQDEKKNILVILNTIKSSLELHESLSESIPQEKLMYLSSNVIPHQRLRRIQKIKDNPRRGLIIVSTQVVEAGVDIDVDIVFRDLAPLDSIIQACGRCNRNDAKACARVIVFQLAKENRAYWKYIYDETLVYATKEILQAKGSPIPESDFWSLANEYYAALKARSSTDISEKISRNLKRLNYDDALDTSQADSFKLIEVRSCTRVFVALDSDAIALYESYKMAQKQDFPDVFARRIALKTILRQMGAYMINVDKRLVKTEDPIFFVEPDEVSLYYDAKTGFKREQKQEDYIF